MILRLSHTGKHDLIIQSNAVGNRRLRPLSWWEAWRKRYVEIEIGDNELVVIRTAAGTEPDGQGIRSVV